MNARSSRCSRKALTLLLVASSALLLAGCLSDGKLADFSAGDAKLAVSLPVVCEAFLQPVPPPAVTEKSDARVAYTRAADALDDVNGRIVDGRDCLRDQRQDYAGKKGSK